MRAGIALVAVLLAGCASGATLLPSGATRETADRPGYVDGIRIPTPAPTTATRVVPAPSSCPASWRTIVARSETRGDVTLQTDTSAYLITCTYNDRDAAATDCSQ